MGNVHLISSLPTVAATAAIFFASCAMAEVPGPADPRPTASPAFAQADTFALPAGVLGTADRRSGEPCVNGVLPTSAMLDAAGTVLGGCTVAPLKLEGEASGNDRIIGFEVRHGDRDCLYGECKVSGFSGRVKFGASTGSKSEPAGWYIFAGSDGTALVWDAPSVTRMPGKDDMRLRDELTVGDMEAGVSIVRGSHEISLTYIHSQVEHETWDNQWEDREDFVGVQLSLPQ